MRTPLRPSAGRQCADRAAWPRELRRYKTIGAKGEKAPSDHAERLQPTHLRRNANGTFRRRTVRQEVSAPLVVELEGWLREQRARLSCGNDLARASTTC